MVYAKKHLLTGAGFTHNFGTPLAMGLWAEIFNNKEIHTSPKLRELLLNSFDYEEIYYSVVMNINSSYSEEERIIIQNAVKKAYDHIDAIVREYRFSSDSPYPVNIYGVQEFINEFASQNGKSFFFTLNQDLFVERRYFNGKRPSMPGLKVTYELSRHLFSSIFTQEVNDQLYHKLPTYEQLETVKDDEIRNSDFFYVKLHGSYNWRSAKSTNHMVIGKEKKSQILEEPLLNWYYDLFKNVLSTNDIMLYIIGYGFGDIHINAIIADNIKNNGLKLYVMNPSNINEFRDFLYKRDPDNGSTIYKGIYGYYPYRLIDLFPSNQERTQAWNNVIESFFRL